MVPQQDQLGGRYAQALFAIYIPWPHLGDWTGPNKVYSLGEEVELLLDVTCLFHQYTPTSYPHIVYTTLFLSACSRYRSHCFHSMPYALCAMQNHRLGTCSNHLSLSHYSFLHLSHIITLI